jgi:hypothetical protein
MMQTTRRPVTIARLVQLERTVDSLNGQLRDIHGKLIHSKTEPFPVRLWRSLTPQSKAVFMSAVCNQRIRPNTKVVTYAGL